MMVRLQWFLLLLCFASQPFDVQGTAYFCNTTAPCGCSSDTVNVDARIVGGELAAIQNWAWAVSLRVLDTTHFCGGSILSSHYIVTAAHCVEDPVMSYIDITAAIGTDYLYDSVGQRIEVDSIHIHPDWNTVTKENDIALLKLKKAVSFSGGKAAKMCLPPVHALVPTDFPTNRSNLVAVGWGSTYSTGDVSSFLQQVTIQAVSNDEMKCRNSINNDRFQFCAAVDGGGKDTCQGDSGGPLMFYSQEWRQWMLAGITSYGTGCGLPTHAGIYTRVTMYVDWIKSVVGNDGVVVAGENHAHIMTVSHTLWVILSALIVFINHSK